LIILFQVSCQFRADFFLLGGVQLQPGQAMVNELLPVMHRSFYSTEGMLGVARRERRNCTGNPPTRSAAPGISTD
jgi:hypothetical protein